MGGVNQGPKGALEVREEGKASGGRQSRVERSLGEEGRRKGPENGG